MIQMNPLVTVLMPVYNAEKYLSEAIDSILAQTYKNIEFMIINDGSTDRSESIILDYQSRNSKIVYVKNETNIKLIATLNKGVKMANGKYIVRMDADDISKPFRIEKQVEYMESHPSVGVCGSFFTVFGEGINKPYIIKRPLGNINIKASMLFTNAIGHPNVIIRRSVMIDNDIFYDKRFYRIEDWGLWTQLIPCCDFGNLPYSVLEYRRTPTQETALETADPQSRIYRKRLLEENLIINKIIGSERQIDCLLSFLQNDHKTMTNKDLENAMRILKEYSNLGYAYKKVVVDYVWSRAKRNKRVCLMMFKMFGFSLILDKLC